MVLLWLVIFLQWRAHGINKSESRIETSNSEIKIIRLEELGKRKKMKKSPEYEQFIIQMNSAYNQTN